MWTLLTAALAAPPIGDIYDVDYLLDSRRASVALPWLVERLEAEDPDIRVLQRWLQAHAVQPRLADRSVVRAQVEAWAAASDHPAAAAAVATAIGLEALGPNTSSIRILPARGPWCDDAEAVLSVVPEDPAAAWQVLRQRNRFAQNCGWEAASTELHELATSGAVDPWFATWYRADEEGFTDELVAAFVDGVRETPPRLRWFSNRLHDEGGEVLAGPVRELAEASLTSERPVVVAAAMFAFRSLEDKDGVRRALDALDRLDPAHSHRWMRGYDPEVVAEAIRNDDSETSLDPEARIAAFERAKPPKNDWDRRAHYIGYAEALDAVGRSEEAAKAWYEAITKGDARGTGPLSRLTELALTTGSFRRQAHKLLDAYVDRAAHSGLWSIHAESARAAREEREALAAVLVLRARLDLADDDVDAAHASLRQALKNQPSHAEALARLGLIDARDRTNALTLALAHGLADPDLEARASAALEEALGDAWLPGGLYGYLEAARAAVGDADDDDAPEALPDLGLPPDLEIHWKGETRRLADLPRPMVIELWATWCGPCVQALPHMDLLARRHEGVHFLALSVDKEEQLAVDHLGDTHAFDAAWSGPETMQAFGVTGIPAAFVLDEDGRIRALINGYGPGSVALDEALAALAAE
jgi:thiol-disulfide isomerase/thioredoxin